MLLGLQPVRKSLVEFPLEALVPSAQSISGLLSIWVIVFSLRAGSSESPVRNSSAARSN